MADTKISALTAVTSPAYTDEFVVNQAGTSKKVTLAQLRGGGVYNVADYGAVGDGSTDDTTAINNAITAANSAGGGTVWLPEGTFITTGITLRSFVTLRGAAGWASILKLASSGTSAVVGGASGLSYAGIMDLKIDGNKSTVSESYPPFKMGFAVDAGSPNNCFAINCHITNTMHSAIYYTGSRFRALGNTITNIGSTTGATGETGIVISGEYNPGGWCQVIGNNIDTCAEYGIKAYVGSDYSVISDNVIDSVAKYGIYVQNNKGVSVTGNTIYATTAYGIVVQGDNASYPAEDNIVSGNAVEGTTQYGGILLWSNATSAAVRNTVVSNNTVRDNATYGIRCLASSGSVNGVTISGNTCTGNAAGGISLESTNNAAVTGNVCRNNGTASSGYGITASASDYVACTGNRCYDDASGYQDYGISAPSGCDYWVIIGNVCTGNTVDGVLASGTGTVADHNLE